MSIGYETQIPPISTLTFYNAIANGGKLMQPRFVKQIVKNGEVIYNNPPKVLKSVLQRKTHQEYYTHSDGSCFEGLVQEGWL